MTASFSFGFDVPGDLELTSDRTGLVMSTGVRLMLEQVRSALGTARGSWFYDLARGFPYNEILGVIPDLTLIRMLFANWLQSEFDFISSVDEVRLDYDSEKRSLRIQWEATTETGEYLNDSIGVDL
jgi:hypothetical protein